MMPTSLNLYLCNDSVTNELDVLSTKAKKSVNDGNLKWEPADVTGLDKAIILNLKPVKSDPKWVNFLNIYFPNVEGIYSQSVGAILYIEAIGKKFVLPFGIGYSHLDESKLVNDFGLMITANEVKEDSLRFMDSNNPSAGTKARYQSDRLSRAAGFDLDSALAFIKKLGGLSASTDLGKAISGSSGLKFEGPDDVALLSPYLSSSLNRYSAVTYKERGLEIIGAMKPIVSPKSINALDALMLDSVRADDGEFVLCAPALIDWDTVGAFRYGGWRDRTEYPDVLLADYLVALQNDGYDINGPNFALDIKDKHTVGVHKAESGVQIKSWPIYRCLQGSVDFDGNRYSLSDGRWYFVAKEFRAGIKESFEQARNNVDDTVFPKAKIVINKKQKGKKTLESEGVEAEGEYNKRTAAELGLVYLDKETGSVPGIANQRNELCDLLSMPDRRLIHVKKGSRSSGSLHHLFRQGATAARMLRDPKFLASIGNKLRAGGRDSDAISVESLGKGEITIEFRVIDKPRSDGKYDIPFFAKVALHYAMKEIIGAACDVKLGFIDQD